MDLGSIIKKSWDEYWNNFKSLLYITFIFIGIPTLLAFIVFFFFGITYSESMDLEEMLVEPVALTAFGILAILGVVLYLIYEAGLVKESMKSKAKFNFHKVKDSGMKNFWKFVWFSLVTFFFIALLLLALIIPGIIFGIYWSVAIFVYFDSNKNVMESLRTSFHMVRGNWWRVFGYTVVLILIFVIVGMVTELLGYVLTEMVSNFVNTLFTAPFAILFYKNVYLGLKGSSKPKKKKKK